MTACTNDLEQFPELEIEATSLDDFTPVLNAAYFYQQTGTTPLAVMGDFRADNMLMEEEPYPAFDRFDSDLGDGDLVGQFFQPFYAQLYQAILSCNNIIENSSNANEVGEAQFLRALSYFKLVKVFGGVTMITEASPSTSDATLLARGTVEEGYSLIISDLNAATAALDNSGLANGRATAIAAWALLGKVQMQMGDFAGAETSLATVVNGASSLGIELQSDFAAIFAEGADLNSEIIFATQQSSSIDDLYGFTLFPGWFSGGDTKSLAPLDPDLVAAFDASPGDLRRDLTIDASAAIGSKWGGGLEQDWIELRLGDIILLYGESLNENGNSSAAITELNKIRSRAGLAGTTASGQADLRQAFADERRLELALEGQRWFDLVRTGTVNAEMGMTIDPQFYVFPLPQSEVLASGGVITQNPGY